MLHKSFFKNIMVDKIPSSQRSQSTLVTMYNIDQKKDVIFFKNSV
jgi:hypothetical protein